MTPPTLLEALEAAASGAAVLAPGVFATPEGELCWDADGIALGERALAADALVAIQLARSVELVRPGGLAKLLGAAPRRVAKVHLELRTRTGERVRLSATASEAQVRGLPELRSAGAEVPLATLRAVAETALAHGASLARVELDALGEQPLAPEPTDPELLYEDRAAVVDEHGKWGYRNGAGELVIAYQFDNAARFSDGFAAVQVKGRWGYVDAYGAWLREPDLRDAGPVFGWFALVRSDAGPARLFVNGVLAPSRQTVPRMFIEAAGLLLVALALMGVMLVSGLAEGNLAGSLVGGAIYAAFPAALGWARRREALGLRDGRRRRGRYRPHALPLSPAPRPLR